MTPFQIIAAIDLLGGQAVRLRQGRYDEVTRYDEPPAELARRFRGASPRLHVVDLEGARSGEPSQLSEIRAIVEAFGPGVQVGGGVRSRAAAEAYLELGAERVVMGTLALRAPEILEATALAAPGRVIVALDARDGKVATDGWLSQSEQSALEVAQSLAKLPLAAVLYTDIERDGTEVGPNVEATARLAQGCGLPVIASGGVGRLEHLTALSRRRADGVVGVVVGRALHEGRFTLEQAAQAIVEG
ncbi:MAG: 1-(5-phosphoribosyl)-5-((5-phosphoribosylamino)methylideneamino)imidazole-4-carboxamide isomerase [Polyangiaceae bacterium]|nr:1-(5-phosphoribosyl)-5-((5-phosphoribosylamino)methylideneamino)imidazole-4-carboxamide isomerase [Polyangiaceae bacterium]MCW5791391.1 1-(5-phosphoribosyl)-5-((5-phosphoribosylamino)methylideneamino)imidazole-4-carboxamide isomerase [Polyangiaceae bacterium]